MTASAGARAPRRDGDTAWLRRFHPAERAEITLVCFPHAGGSASFYFPLSRALSPRIEVLAAQYPARQDRRGEPGIERIEPLAARIGQALSGWTGRRWAFFGHSMGASVAFETARWLERTGRRGPELLFASARRAPSLPTDTAVRLMDDAGIVEELKRLSGTAAVLFSDPELIAAAMPALRADYTAIENYLCARDATVDCPIQVLTADADPLATVEQAREWERHTSAGFAARVFPGGHFYLENWPADVVGTVRERINGLVPAVAAP